MKFLNAYTYVGSTSPESGLESCGVGTRLRHAEAWLGGGIAPLSKPAGLSHASETAKLGQAVPSGPLGRPMPAAGLDPPIRSAPCRGEVAR